MFYVKFDAANKTLRAPESWDEEKLGPCNPLPVYWDEERNYYLSVWMPDEAEREKLANGHGIALYVHSGNHPPVGLEVIEVEIDGQEQQKRDISSQLDELRDISGIVKHWMKQFHPMGGFCYEGVLYGHKDHEDGTHFMTNPIKKDRTSMSNVIETQDGVKFLLDPDTERSE